MDGVLQGNTPKHPRVNLNAFAEFISSGPSGRLDCVQRQIANYSSDYRPGADFYKDFCDAVREGRATESDELTLRRCVASQRQQVRQKHYDVLARHWLKMTKWHLPLAPVSRAVWTLPALSISVSPHFGLQLPDSRTAVVRFWLREHEPSPDAVRAIQWLMLEKMPAICPAGVPLVIDVRRERANILGKRPFKKGYEDVLRAEAMSMGLLWSSRAETA